MSATSEQRIAALEQKVAELTLALTERPESATAQANRLSLMVFSGSMDRVLAAFILATTAAAAGMEVQMFFTFWGLGVLRDRNKKVAKSAVERALSSIVPKGADALPLSQMNLGGLGAGLLRQVMIQRRVATLQELLTLAAEMGVVLNACEMSLGVMGLKLEEFIDYPGLTCCGAATFLAGAASGKLTMFI